MPTKKNPKNEEAAKQDRATDTKPINVEVQPKVQTAEGWRRAKQKEIKEGRK